MNSTPWVELKRFFDLPTAQLVAAKLSSEGIPTSIPDQMTQSTLTHLGPVLGGVRLLVQPENLKRAQEILESYESQPNGHDRDGNIIFSRFGGRALKRSKFRWLTLLLALVFLLFLLIQLIANQ